MKAFFTLIVLVSSFTLLSATIQITSTQCICGANGTGSIEVEATGTAGPFTFAWEGPNNYESTVQNPNDITTPGTYTVIVTNAYGCQTVLPPVDIVICDGIDQIQLSTANTCEGGTIGSVQPTITGGLAPYTYQWSNGATSKALEGLGGGEYCVTVTDANGCTAEQCATVGSVQTLTAQFDVTHTCGDASEGSIILTPSGTQSFYFKNWSNGATGNNNNNLAAGVYTLTLTDGAYGCTLVTSATVESLVVPTIEANITYSTCAAIADGSISLTILGGAPPLNIQWSNGADTETISNLPGTAYCVTVTESNGCEVSDCFSTLPTVPQAEAPYIKRVQVFAEAVSDGTQTLIYDAEWIASSGGCVVFTGGMQSIDDVLFASMQAEGQSLRIEASPSKVMDDMDLIFQGASVYMGDINGVWSSTVSAGIVSGLTANNELYATLKFAGQDLLGNALVDLRIASADMSKCTTIPALQPDCSWSPNHPTGQDDVHVLERSCAELIFTVNNIENIISVSMPDGTSPFNYIWSGPNGYINTDNVFKIYPPESGDYCVTVTDVLGCKAKGCVPFCDGFEEAVQMEDFITLIPTCPNGTGGSICLEGEIGGFPVVVDWVGGPANSLCWDNLNNGTYQVKITELFCGETVSLWIDLNESVQTLPSVVLSSATASCPGVSDGALCVTTTGGKPPYTYLWGTGNTSACISGLSENTCYDLTVTDDCGQTTTGCFNVPAYNPNLSVSADVQESCEGVSGGYIHLTVTGGNGPYNYAWQPEGMLLYPSKPDRNNLAPGNYPVTVTDACGTQISVEYVVGTIGAEEGMITIESVTVQPSCGNPNPNGTIQINASTSPGGYPLTYNWGNEGTAVPALVISNLQPGSYTVTITNSYGCELVETVEVPDAFSENHTSFIIDACGSVNGSIKINSTPPYCYFNYTWSTGAVTSSSNTSELTNLPAGNYCVTITSENCAGATAPCYIVERCFEIIQNPPLNIPLSTVTIEPSCGENNGLIAIKGLQPLSLDFQYSWNNGATTDRIEGLSPGQYCVTVTAVGLSCPYEGCFTVEYAEPPVIAVEEVQPGTVVSYPFIGDFYVPDGSIDISVNGGSPPFTYEWSNGATTQDLTDITAGTYVVTVTDGNGCTDSYTFIVPSCYTSPIIISLENFTPPTPSSGGSLNVSVQSDNLGNLIYEWTGPNGFTAATQDIELLTFSGEYSLTVTNPCGGSATFSKVLIDCNAVSIDLSAQDPCINPFNLENTKIMIDAIHLPFGSNYIGYYDVYEFEWGRYQDDGDWHSMSTENSAIDAYGSDDDPYWRVIDEDARTLSPILWADDYCVRISNDLCTFPETCMELKKTYTTPDWYWWDDLSGISDDNEHNFIIYPYFDSFNKAITSVNKCKTCVEWPYFFGLGNCKNDPTSSFFEYKPKNYNEPCSGGGDIIIHKDTPEEYIISVPSNWESHFESGDQCACLFPAGLIPQMVLRNGEVLPVYVEFPCTPEGEIEIIGYDCLDIDESCTMGCQNNFTEMINDGATCEYEIICLNDNALLDLLEFPSTLCYKEHYYPYTNTGGGNGYLFDVYSFCECTNGGYLYEWFYSFQPQDIPECACNSIPLEPEAPPVSINNYSGSNGNTNLTSTTEGKKETITKLYSLSGHDSIYVFPNPFSRTISFVVNSETERLLKFKLLNILGQEITSKNNEILIGEQTFTIDVPEYLPEGIYFVLLEDETGTTKMFKLMHTAY